MPVVHENLYVYAADKTERGMALAEKWRLTLVQPSCSSNKDKKPKGERRTSILLGPGKSSPGKSPTDNTLAAQPASEETALRASDQNKSVVEEVKYEDVAEEEGTLPGVLIVENDYF